MIGLFLFIIIGLPVISFLITLFYIKKHKTANQKGEDRPSNEN